MIGLLTLLLAAPPLTVGEGGQLLRDGQPCRAVGINYFDAFLRTVKQPENTSYRDGFKVLREHGIPFVRFAACGFWPHDWQPYRDDPEGWFRRLDGVVKAAEEFGLGLIPSLFWNQATIGDLVGEPRRRWGDADSRTIAFMRRYVEQVVGRYKDSPAIWAWEFGNEFNLAIDLPNAAQHRPTIVPHWGTPTERSAEDDIDTTVMVTALRLFGEAVRALDPDRPITSGHSIPRPAATHMRLEGSWRKDTRAEHAATLALQHPAPLNLWSVHIYPVRDGEYFADEAVDLDGLIAAVAEAARTAGQPLMIGEFGVGASYQGDARSRFADFLASFARHRVPLAAAWNFDRMMADKEWNITPAGDRAWLLTALGEANRAAR